MARKEVQLKARTTKEIKGDRIDTIPIGTEFIITHIDMDQFKDPTNFRSHWSCCKGLGISDIWNDEFELLEEV